MDVGGRGGVQVVKVGFVFLCVYANENAKIKRCSAPAQPQN